MSLGSRQGSVERPEELALHRAVFANDAKLIAQHIRDGADVAFKDVHGNTALHLAVMLGHRDSLSLLLAHDAPVKSKNTAGWSPLAEAISYGDRPTIAQLLRKLKKQSRDAIQGKKPHLVQMLTELGDFYMELKWDFHSWIPLVSKILPSDVCKIYKRGACLRMDTTLVDFNERTWERGDISFIFDAAARAASDSLVILDNKAKVFQRVKYEESDVDLEDELDVLMSSDIVNAQMSTKTISFSRATTGWIFKTDKNEKVGDYMAEYFGVDGLFLDSRKRREHLTADDIKKNKALISNLQTGTISEEEWKEQRRRKTVPAPPPSRVSWDDYISACPGNPPIIGRPHSDKNFRATVGMSTDFPLEMETLLDILEIVAPFKHLNKLRRFCQVRLPPGFPVRIEIPLLPTIVAKITFQKFAFREDLEAKLFTTPNSYREDSTRFPDFFQLSGGVELFGGSCVPTLGSACMAVDFAASAEPASFLSYADAFTPSTEGRMHLWSPVYRRNLRGILPDAAPPAEPVSLRALTHIPHPHSPRPAHLRSGFIISLNGIGAHAAADYLLISLD